MRESISELKANREVDTYFAVGALTKKTARNGNNYIELLLFDATGQMRAFVWDDLDGVDELAGAVVKVRGMTYEYNGSLTLKVEYVRSATYDEVDITELLPVVPGGVEQWKGRLLEKVATINDECCRGLIDAFVSDLAFMEAFLAIPGGLWVHHNYVGGLLEHTVSVMDFADFLAQQNSALLNRDVLLCGAFLHDIGKTRELSRLPLKEYTTSGKLIGHIPMGIGMVNEKISEHGSFPEELVQLITHMIWSHHGEAEFGSPVRPATTEAVVLHMADNLDAKLNNLYCHLGTCNPSDAWSTYDKYLKNEIYQRRWHGRGQGCKPWRVRIGVN